jgi:hypothetical protein
MVAGTFLDPATWGTGAYLAGPPAEGAPEKGASHEWHEDSRKSFRGNRIRCQHINASATG